MSDKRKGEKEVLVKGHPLRLYAIPNCRCGGEDGVAFRFSGECGWIIPWMELERLLKFKKTDKSK